jgi:glycosyltransferase involved in cell wall biosynthesis
MKISIIIPVYNEAPTVAELLQRVRAVELPGIDKEIVIVESNSKDGSREIVAGFIQRHARDSAGIVLIQQSEPRGKGFAVRAGLAAATGDVILIQDGDLEYDVTEYADLLEPIIQGRASFVIGSRHLGTDPWHVRQFANNTLQAALMNFGDVLFRGLFNTLFRTRLTDPTSMYKVFRAECLAGLTFGCRRFDFDFELVGKLVRAGFVPLEVPVSYKSRGFDQGKKIRIFRDPPGWILAILRTRFAPLHAARRQDSQSMRTVVARDVASPVVRD